MTLLFRVDGEPQPWPKENRANRNGKIWTYYRDPDGSKRAWREKVKLACIAACQGKPVPVFVRDVPVVVSYEFYCPKTVSCKHRFMVIKPDLDNLEYAVTNALNGVAYHDDRQIVARGKSFKMFADGFDPHAIIKIESFTDNTN